MIDLSFFKGPNEIQMEIAGNVKARRKEKKMTQKELSERADVSLGSIKRFEQTGEISLNSLIKIAFALNCQDDFEQLFSQKQFATMEELIRAQNIKR